MLESNPGKSCDDIYKINKVSSGASDNYWINTTTGLHQVAILRHGTRVWWPQGRLDEDC